MLKGGFKCRKKHTYELRNKIPLLVLHHQIASIAQLVEQLTCNQ